MPALTLHRRNSPFEESKLPRNVEYSEPVRRMTLAANSHKKSTVLGFGCLCPFKTEKVSVFKIHIHHLFYTASAFGCNTFIEQ